MVIIVPQKQVKDILINSNIDFNVPFSMQKKAELRKLRKQVCAPIFVVYIERIRSRPRFAKIFPT